jgi:hypothetical protein
MKRDTPAEVKMPMAEGKIRISEHAMVNLRTMIFWKATVLRKAATTTESKTVRPPRFPARRENWQGNRTNRPSNQRFEMIFFAGAARARRNSLPWRGRELSRGEQGPVKLPQEISEATRETRAEAPAVEPVLSRITPRPVKLFIRHHPILPI